MHWQISFRVGLCILVLSGTGILHAQAPPSRRLDLSITYIAEHSLKSQTSQNFWMQGGSIELGTNVWRGWGVAADVTGTHNGSVGSSGLPLSLVTTNSTDNVQNTLRLGAGIVLRFPH